MEASTNDFLFDFKDASMTTLFRHTIRNVTALSFLIVVSASTSLVPQVKATTVEPSDVNVPKSVVILDTEAGAQVSEPGAIAPLAILSLGLFLKRKTQA